MVRKINCIVLDDEPHAVRLLESYVRCSDYLNLIYAGIQVDFVLELIEQEEGLLIFLDIEMPELSGIDILKKFVHRNDVRFILTTAYSEYALEGYEYNVVDYLLKPISSNRFLQAVEKYIKTFHTYPNSDDEVFLQVKVERSWLRISIQHIVYIEGLKDYIRIHFWDPTKQVFKHCLTLENMKDILQHLPEVSFKRVHRSFIINQSQIQVQHKDYVILRNGIKIPIGATYKNVLS